MAEIEFSVISRRCLQRRESAGIYMPWSKNAISTGTTQDAEPNSIDSIPYSQRD